MSTLTRPLTYEDLCRKREDGNRYELIDGEFVLVASPSPEHQRLSRGLFLRFQRVVGDGGLGEVFYAPLDVRLADGSIVQPDVIVVLHDRAQIVADKLIEGAPSLLVEIESPSSRAVDWRRKAGVYARTGVPEYWRVEPEARAITVHADPTADTYRIVRRETEVAQAVTVPGLVVDLGALFAGAPAPPTGVGERGSAG